MAKWFLYTLNAVKWEHVAELNFHWFAHPKMFTNFGHFSSISFTKVNILKAFNFHKFVSSAEIVKVNCMWNFPVFTLFPEILENNYILYFLLIVCRKGCKQPGACFKQNSSLIMGWSFFYPENHIRSIFY